MELNPWLRLPARLPRAAASAQAHLTAAVKMATAAPLPRPNHSPQTCQTSNVRLRQNRPASSQTDRRRMNEQHQNASEPKLDAATGANLGRLTPLLLFRPICERPAPWASTTGNCEMNHRAFRQSMVPYDRIVWTGLKLYRTERLHAPRPCADRDPLHWTYVACLPVDCLRSDPRYCDARPTRGEADCLSGLHARARNGGAAEASQAGLNQRWG